MKELICTHTRIAHLYSYVCVYMQLNCAAYVAHNKD